jgi:hypothetical protein
MVVRGGVLRRAKSSIEKNLPSVFACQKIIRLRKQEIPWGIRSGKIEF